MLLLMVVLNDPLISSLHISLSINFFWLSFCSFCRINSRSFCSICKFINRTSSFTSSSLFLVHVYLMCRYIDCEYLNSLSQYLQKYSFFNVSKCCMFCLWRLVDVWRVKCDLIDVEKRQYLHS